MNKYIFQLLFLLFCVLIIIGCNKDLIENGSYVVIKEKKIYVEIADDPSERQIGLMFREELCEDCGMLFIFETEDIPSFWMKNTLIPLDMVFIKSDLMVANILKAEPCTEDPCESYEPKSEALYVLETNQGEFDEGIIGTKIQIYLQ